MDLHRVDVVIDRRNGGKDEVRRVGRKRRLPVPELRAHEVHPLLRPVRRSDNGRPHDVAIETRGKDAIAGAQHEALPSERAPGEAEPRR